jgi:hypothetical protein
MSSASSCGLVMLVVHMALRLMLNYIKVTVTPIRLLAPFCLCYQFWNEDGQRSKHRFFHGYLYHLAYFVLPATSITLESLQIRLVWSLVQKAFVTHWIF